MKSGMAFSGKELFDFNPDWVADDDDGAADGGAAMDYYERQDSDHEGESNEPVAQYLGEDGGVVDLDDFKDMNILPKKDKGKGVVVQEDLFASSELAGLDDDDDDEQ